MLRNRPLQNMPGWAQQFMNELLKPPHFLVTQDKASPAQAATNEGRRVSPKRPPSGGRRQGDITSARHIRAEDMARASDELDAIPIEPNRRWRAALVRTDIPESALYAYGWDISEVTRHQNIVRVATDDGDFALKMTHIPAKRVRFIEKAMANAKSQGFDRFSAIVRATNGRPYCLYNGQVCYASRWVSGTEANFALATQVGQIARTLAEWHQATHGFQPEGYRPDSEFALSQMLQSRYEDLRILLAEAENKAEPDPFDSTFISMGSTLRKDAQRSIQLMESADVAAFLKKDMKNPGLCHLDVIPGNFIYDKDKNIHLLDLDLSTYAPRALDLAHLLRRSLERANWNTEMAYNTFLNYHEVTELERAEYAMVHGLLTFPYRVWRLARTRYRVLADNLQVEELKNAAAEETRRRAFLDSYARQIRPPE